jgi:hypothetical protein
VPGRQPKEEADGVTPAGFFLCSAAQPVALALIGRRVATNEPTDGTRELMLRRH